MNERGDIKKFREYLNTTTEGTAYREGPFGQRTRKYGDYLYKQDPERFLVDLADWIKQGRPSAKVEGPKTIKRRAMFQTNNEFETFTVIIYLKRLGALKQSHEAAGLLRGIAELLEQGEIIAEKTPETSIL